MQEEIKILPHLNLHGVYFYQKTGALHTDCWSKLSFSAFKQFFNIVPSQMFHLHFNHLLLNKTLMVFPLRTITICQTRLFVFVLVNLRNYPPASKTSRGVY